MRGALLGALWGFGHSIGQLLLGLLMVVLKVRPLHALTTSTLEPCALELGCVT